MFFCLFLYVALFPFLMLEQCFGMEKQSIVSQSREYQDQPKSKWKYLKPNPINRNPRYKRETEAQYLDKNSFVLHDRNSNALNMYHAISENDQDTFDSCSKKLSRNDCAFMNYPREESLVQHAYRLGRSKMFVSLLNNLCRFDFFVYNNSKNRDVIERQQVLYKNSKNYEGKSLAHSAAINNSRVNVLNALRSIDTNLEAKDNDGMTPLALSVQLNRERIVDNLLAEGIDRSKKAVDIHTTNKYGSQLLHFVKSPSIAQKLLSAGADVGACNRFGSQPLHYAQSVEVIKVLCNAGADPNAQNNDGFTPLHYVSNIDKAKELIERGANPCLKSHLGKTPREYINDKEMKCFFEARKCSFYVTNQRIENILSFLEKAEIEHNSQQNSPVSIAMRKNCDVEDSAAYIMPEQTPLIQKPIQESQIIDASSSQDVVSNLTINTGQFQNIHVRKDTHGIDKSSMHVNKKQKM